ncbi:hypothetical protein C8J57DRAFT_1377615 [Mycena rebaudengoi]|nr:hypothetical protein C8J57DRAFT_1377615 [Mycena rebaudengoi]
MSAGNVTAIFPDAGETPAEYEFERTLMIGSFVGAMTWGIHLMVYGTAMYFSVIKLRQLEQRLTRSNLLSWVLIVYMTVLFALCTIYMGANIQDNVNMFINHRNNPGGPLVYGALAYRSPLILLGTNICPVIAIFMTDSLLLWRLYIIWGRIWTLVLPSLMLIASVVMGILLLFTSALPGHTFNSADAVRFGTAYFSISLSMTVIVTLTIVFRLLYLQRIVMKLLGNAPDDKAHYISASTILLESSSMYALVGFIFLVLYNKNSPVSNAFTGLMVQVMCISSDLVILRVAIGTAWTAQASQNISSSLAFCSGPPGTSATEIESSTIRKSLSGSVINIDTKA